MDEENNKFTESEIVVGGLFTLGIDGVCALIDLTGIGMGIAPIIQGFSVFAIDQWVRGKGGASWGTGKQMTQYAAGLLPALPTTTAVFAIRVFVHNHPQITEAATKIASKTLKKAA